MREDINAEANKDPNDLEREVDQQRAYINETLDALEQRFSPGQIVDQVLSYTRSNSGDFSRNLVDTVKSNPMPTLLTATGLLWMMYGQNHNRSGQSHASGYPTKASYGVDPAYSTGASYDTSSGGNGRGAGMKDKAGKLKEGASGSMGKAKDRLHQMGDSAGHAGGGARQQASHYAQDARHYAHDAQNAVRNTATQATQGFQRMLKEQPLAVGAIGIALGALVGAALPESRREDELMGDKRDDLMDQARHQAEDAKQSATEAGKRFAEDAQQTASEAGQRLAEDAKKEAKSVTQSQPQSQPRH
jgi:ElaB/YqjD/DUF883 family membrane-anchored ribosome-binding protein